MASEDLTPADGSTLRARIVCAVALLALGDAIVTTYGAIGAHAGAASSAIAAAAVIAFITGAMAIVCVPLVWLLSRAGARALVSNLNRGIGGGDSEASTVGTTLFAIAIAIGGAWIVGGGFRVAETQSAKVAVVETLGAAIALVFVAAAFAASVTKAIATRVRATWTRIGTIARVAILGVATVVAVIALARIFSVVFAIPLTMGLIGLAIGPRLALAVPILRRPPAIAAALFAITGMIFAGIELPRLPPPAQVATLYQSSYAAQIIGLARQFVDVDGDGYSPILMGGDCNDHDPTIHPGAVDRPNNGKDENCSGADAREYTPPAPPRPSYPQEPPKRLNVVLVQMDALRPDHLGFAGYSRNTTPNLDQFRKNATWFHRSYTPAPTTRLAMAAIFVGRDIDRVPQRRGPGMDFTLLPEASTIAERLAPLGYDRAGYTISYVVQHIHDVGQGFDPWQTPWPVGQWASTYENAAELTTTAGIKHLAEIPEDGSKPYFLFLHYQCTHDPYIKHPKWDYGGRDIDIYDSALSYCDDQLGRLFATLDARADKAKTAIIFFSDHGELFGEHGLANHGHSLYEPDVRTLLLARIPGGITSDVETPVSLIDLDPTILELTNGSPDKDSAGWSLVPFMMTKVNAPRRDIFLYGDITRGGVHYQGRGIVEWPYKLIRDIGTGVVQLFDVEHDPEELTNLADARVGIRDRIGETLDGWEAFEAKR